MPLLQKFRAPQRNTIMSIPISSKIPPLWPRLPAVWDHDSLRGSNLYRDTAPLATKLTTSDLVCCCYVPISTETPPLWPLIVEKDDLYEAICSNLYRDATPLAISASPRFPGAFSLPSHLPRSHPSGHLPFLFHGISGIEPSHLPRSHPSGHCGWLAALWKGRDMMICEAQRNVGIEKVPERA